MTWVVYVVVQFYHWFKFSFFLFQTRYHVIIIHYHTQKQKKRKFEPRIKLNHNIYIFSIYLMMMARDWLNFPLEMSLLGNSYPPNYSLTTSTPNQQQTKIIQHSVRKTSPETLLVKVPSLCGHFHSFSRFCFTKFHLRLLTCVNACRFPAFIHIKEKPTHMHYLKST